MVGNSKMTIVTAVAFPDLRETAHLFGLGGYDAFLEIRGLRVQALLATNVK